MPTTWRIGTQAGHRLHVREHVPDEATGPDFLLVHGLASNALLWEGVGRRLAAAGHRAVAVDQRGHGRSERAADGPTHDGVLDDLEDVVAALGLDRPVAVGQSWGGNVVVHLAARRPTVVRAIACVDGGHFDLQHDFSGDRDAMVAALDPPDMSTTTWERLEGTIRGHARDWPAEGVAGTLANLVRRHDGGVEAVLRREDHHAILAAMWAHSPVAAAARVRLPALLLPAAPEGGPDDAQRARVERLAAALPTVEVVWAAGRGHDVHAEDPALVADTLLDAVANGTLDG